MARMGMFSSYWVRIRKVFILVMMGMRRIFIMKVAEGGGGKYMIIKRKLIYDYDKSWLISWVNVPSWLWLTLSTPHTCTVNEMTFWCMGIWRSFVRWAISRIYREYLLEVELLLSGQYSSSDIPSFTPPPPPRLFAVINSRVLSANRVDFGFFCFKHFPISRTPRIDSWRMHVGGWRWVTRGSEGEEEKPEGAAPWHSEVGGGGCKWYLFMGMIIQERGEINGKTFRVTSVEIFWLFQVYYQTNFLSSLHYFGISSFNRDFLISTLFCKKHTINDCVYHIAC